MNQPLKIAMLAPYPAGDVVEHSRIRAKYRTAEHPSSWIQNLCAALGRRDDVRICVFVDSRAVTHVQEVTHNSVDFIFLPKMEPARLDPYHAYVPFRWRLKAPLARFAPDIVHGHGTEGGNGVVAVHQDMPSVVSIQGIMELLAPHLHAAPGKRSIWKRLERDVLHRATGLIAKTSFAESWLRGHEPHALVRWIPNALSIEFLHVRPTYERKDILCIGTLSRIKGTDVVLRAMALCKDPDARLVLIGSGDDTASYEALAHSLGISGRVEFAGQLPRKRILDYLSSARLLVVGSRMDTSPNVVTEAHAAGLPVVATRAGGIPSMIEDGETGFVVDLEDSTALAQRINLLLAEPERARTLGQAGRDLVTRRHDPDRVAESHMQFYREVIAAWTKKP